MKALLHDIFKTFLSGKDGADKVLDMKQQTLYEYKKKKKKQMEIKWLGTAGFRIKTGETVFLIDPYLTRNQDAQPVQPLKPSDIEIADHIFISHGHFDHIADIPEIANQTKAMVYCSDGAADTLEHLGTDKDQLKRILENGWETSFEGFKAQAFFSDHIKFDKKLLFTTLLKINLRLPQVIRMAKTFPCGQVLSWRFSIQNKIIHFFGSGGSSLTELEKLALTPVDILMVPLQGHSNICDIASEYIRILKPKIVIPHHQDDFYPPVSQQVDIRPFIKKVTRKCPDTKIKVMEINETWHF